ncbi:MAG: Uma2 family endonuclease [Terriglobia bacterium]|nr:MAG: Uma2 family endonuclease [Terriglobia bacterium]
MATGTLISVQEYLSTSYSPDRDYLDGMVVERTVGEKDHSRLQTDLSTYLNVRAKQWRMHVYVEQRVQVKPTRFRVPDICVVAGAEPEEQIFTAPPLVCIEILSKDDRWSAVQERIDDYLSFGVPHVWVIDPRSRKAYEFTPAGMHEVQELRIAEPDIRVPLRELFD